MLQLQMQVLETVGIRLERETLGEEGGDEGNRPNFGKELPRRSTIEIDAIIQINIDDGAQWVRWVIHDGNNFFITYYYFTESVSRCAIRFYWMQK